MRQCYDAYYRYTIYWCYGIRSTTLSAFLHLLQEQQVRKQTFTNQLQNNTQHLTYAATPIQTIQNRTRSDATTEHVKNKATQDTSHNDTYQKTQEHVYGLSLLICYFFTSVRVLVSLPFVLVDSRSPYPSRFQSSRSIRFAPIRQSK